MKKDLRVQEEIGWGAFRMTDGEIYQFDFANELDEGYGTLQKQVEGAEIQTVLDMTYDLEGRPITITVREGENVVCISNAQLNLIQEALAYAADQTLQSEGDVEAFAWGSMTVRPEDRVELAHEAVSLTLQLLELEDDNATIIIED